MKLKTLTLLILSAIVIASVACGPSAKEQKELIQEQKTIMLCEDALERVKTLTSSIDEAFVYGSKVGYRNTEGIAYKVNLWQSDLTEAKADKAKYCK